MINMNYVSDVFNCCGLSRLGGSFKVKFIYKSQEGYIDTYVGSYAFQGNTFNTYLHKFIVLWVINIGSV